MGRGRQPAKITEAPTPGAQLFRGFTGAADDAPSSANLPEASMGPRTIVRGNRACWPSLRFQNLLQRGRGQSSAEMHGPGVFGDPLCDASMGPRTIVRGNDNSYVVAANTFGLQWGRGQSSAEISRNR